MINQCRRKMILRSFLAIAFLGLTSSPIPAAKKSPAEDNSKQVDKTFEQLKLLLDVYQQINQNYVEEVDAQNLIYGAAAGMVATLDPYSQFMVPEAREEMQTTTEGQFGGLGIRIMMKEGWLTVITPLPDTPAYKAGVLPEDRIIMIDDVSTQGVTLQDAVKKLRGAPKTQVKVTLAREGVKEPISFTLTRENIQIVSIRSRMLKDGIAHVRLTEFIEPTVRDLEIALKNLEKQGMKSLILDLRNDPGGLLVSAVDVCKEFIGDQKLIVYTEGRAQPRQEFRAGVTAPYKKLPIVVLINRGSASGSEIVAGAMQDWGRAVLIGSESFGKGSVQSVISLDDGSGLRLTTAKYYTPSGRSIHRDPKSGKGGIQPDIEIPVDRETEAKLQAQSEEIYAKGKESQSAVPEKERVVDVALERAMEVLKIRTIFMGQKEG
ncbi:MAG: Carboxy-terminal processing protease CtpB [Elusimicrobia bacterium]|nr:Carboxy-terminal processing protease CtpB [Elusimicrobiota bacterium]